MKLFNGLLRPGKVLMVDDEQKGVIKASAPGLFSSKDKPELLPPIMPFFGFNANKYSEPLVGDEVWVMNFEDNPLQLFWFRKDSITNNKSILDKETNVEIICNRNRIDDKEKWATIYFSDGSGWIIKNDNSIIQIRPDGSILLDTGKNNRKIDINDKNISIGSIDQSAEPAVLGNKLTDSLNILKQMITLIKTAAKSNPYTIPISNAIDVYYNQFINSIEPIKSKNVTLD